MIDVSVIIRAYNASNYISQSLYSVINNEYEGIVEIVVCYDSGTKDDTLVKIKRIESILINKHKNILIKIIEHEHMTPFKALLKCGFKHSSGRFISILDADNLYPRKRISILMDSWKRTGVSFIFTPTVIFDHETLKILNKIEAPKNPYNRLNLIKGNYIDASAMFIHRECLDKVIPKLDELKNRVYDWIFEDWLIALLAMKYCTCFYTDTTYSLYRIHQSNLTASKIDIASKGVFNQVREILTLMAFYELERDVLSFKELLALYYALFKRFLRLGFWISKHFNILI